MDIRTLLTQLVADGTFARLATNPTTQFGTRTRRYIGAEILPERNVEQNAYVEDKIRYRTVIANAGTRYSPTQKKGGALVGSFNVQLAESDIASEFTSRDYDALLSMLGTGRNMQAVASLVNFLDTTVVRALVERLEAWRWQAIVSALVLLRGDNSYTEDVPYSNPAGHRANIAAAWTDNANDPFTDIYAMQQVLTDKGYTVRRMIASSRVTGIMARNTKVAARTNRITVNTSGQISGVNGRVALADINAALQADSMPPIERYDLQYRTSTGSVRFLPDTVLVMIGETDNDQTLDLGDATTREILPATLGYTAIGRAAGQATPGRVVRAEGKDDKPPRIEAEGWQTALPVITEPEAIGVLQNI